MNLYFLIKLDQFDKFRHEYTHDFNDSYSYWKDDISIKVASYLYIGGLTIGALQANFMTDWQTSKYASLINLQNDVAKTSLWRSTAVNIPRSGNSETTQNKGKAPMPTMPSYKRPHGIIGLNNHDNYDSFGNNGSKGVFGNKASWRHRKDAKADLKNPSKSHISEKKAKFSTFAFKSE